MKNKYVFIENFVRLTYLFPQKVKKLLINDIAIIYKKVIQKC